MRWWKCHVRAVDRPPVLDSLRDDEAGVEDRHGEHRQREEEGHHGVRLERALHGDHRHQVAEQVGARVPHEAGSRREAVAQEPERRARRDRREHAGRVTVEGERDHRQRGGGDQADAGRQAVDPVDQVDHVGDGDDAEDGQYLTEVDRADAGRVEELHRARVHATEEGQGEVRDRHPVRDRDDRRRDLAEQLHPRGQVDQVVDDADGRDRDRPNQDRAGLLVPGQEDRAAYQHRDQHGEAAELRRRHLVQAALVGDVHRADPGGQRLGGRDQGPDRGTGEDEGEKGVERVGHQAPPAEAPAGDGSRA
jgi:hypothetical protein